MLTVIYEKESVHLANNGVAKGEERLQTLQLWKIDSQFNSS